MVIGGGLADRETIMTHLASSSFPQFTLSGGVSSLN